MTRKLTAQNRKSIEQLIELSKTDPKKYWKLLENKGEPLRSRIIQRLKDYKDGKLD